MTDRYDELLLPEQQDKTVDRVIKALKSSDDLSAKTLNNFRRVLRSGKPIPGFNKDPIKAPPPALKQHMNERLERNPEFAHLIAEVWAETEPQLRDAVREHIDSLDPQAYGGDEIDEDFWDAQVSLLTEKHGDYEGDDILLMTKVCYEHAKMELGDETNAGDDGTDDEATEIVIDTAFGDTASAVLSDVLDRLRSLSAESRAWGEEIPQFAQALNDLMIDKEEERNRLNKLLLEKIAERICIGDCILRTQHRRLEHGQPPHKCRNIRGSARTRRAEDRN